ncbi:MAG: sigma-70 family RNA polymerase sigma factor [Chloroflexota bacterium]
MSKKQDQSDIVLMRCIRKGDQSCLEVLYRRYYNLCYQMAVTLLRDSVAAEEVVQDIFLAIWEKPYKWDSAKGQFSSWLLTVTRYTAIDRLRRENRRLSVLDTPLDTVAHLIVTDHKSQEQLRDNIRVVQQLLKDLPDEQRDVILLAFFRGLTHEQIAKKQNLPIGTVKSRIRLGLKKLRERWQTIIDGVQTQD